MLPKLVVFYLGFLDICLSLVPTIKDLSAEYVPYITVVILVKSLSETHSKGLNHIYSKNVIYPSNNAQCRQSAFNSTLTEC